MSIEKEKNVPGFLKPVFEEILDGIPFRSFERYSEYPAFRRELFKGFRIIPKNLPLIKKTILSAVFSPNPIPDIVEILFQNNLPLLPLIDSFRQDCLFQNLDAYFRIYGRNRVLATMLFSEHDEVRNKAYEWLEKPPDKLPDQNPDPAKRSAELKKLFSPIFDSLRKIETETESENKEQANDASEKAAPELPQNAAGQETLFELKKKLDLAQTDAERQKRELKKVREKLDAASRENKAKTDSVQTLERQNADLQQRLEKTQRECDEQKQLCKQTQTNSLRIEEELKNTIADLNNQVKQQKQKQSDAISENARNAALRRQRDGYRKAYDDLREALNSFVANIPVYKPDDASIPHREQASSADPPQKTSDAEPDDFETLLSKIDYVTDISTDNRKLSKLVSLTDLSLSPDSEISILIDGHNVLNCAIPYGEKQASLSHGDLRDRFADDLQPLHDLLPNSEITLYWDGSYAADSNHGAIKIVYSGGTGDHRADHRIEYYLSYLRNKAPNRPILVVTEDRKMRDRCANDKPVFLTPDQFLSILDIG